MTAPELADLVASWPVQPPWSLRPVGSGTNNLSRFVDAASGRFFLRVYQNTADAGQVGFEHRLLAELDRASLPFRVPSPVTARDGRTVAATADGRLPTLSRLERTVALLHRIGRWRQGLAAPEEAREQAERLLRLDDWLSRARSRPGAAAPRR